MKLTNIKNISEKDLWKIKKLYLDCFDDNQEYVDAYFSTYSKNIYFWYEKDNNDEIKMIASLSKKRIVINSQKNEGGLINSIAVNKKYRNQKIMSNFFNKWLEELKNIFPYIFIQAYNWDVYKKFDFVPITYKSEWILRKDQFLKPIETYKKNDYELMNKIYIDFLRINNIKNYSYKTSKEFKTYNKMLLLDNDKIFQSKKAWIIVTNNGIEDFAYTDLKEFIRLVSIFPQNTKILSYLNLDKRFFTQSSKKTVTTKMLKTNNLFEIDEIYFNDFF